MKRMIAVPEGAGEWSGNPAFRGVLANVVTPATREHERRAEVETQWRVTALITPRDRAFGLGKWSSTVAHRISACAAHGHPRDVY